MKTDSSDDPQLKLTANLVEKADKDLLIFNLRLAHFRLMFICQLPLEGEKTAPVYVKFKVESQEERDKAYEDRKARRESKPGAAGADTDPE
jgi:hypothetical protein